MNAPAVVTSVVDHYASPNLAARIVEIIRAEGKDPNARLDPEELALLDQFHPGGRAATQKLIELQLIEPSTRVIDVGAGLGGAARLLASRLGCHVTCLDPVSDFCEANRVLNELTGLSERVSVHQGSALEIPFHPNSFDVAWMQAAGMNIEDKARLYEGVRRVLRSGGIFLFQEVAAGPVQPLHFPVPWASEPAMNFLIPPPSLREAIGAAGFETILFDDLTDWVLSLPPPALSSALSLAIYVSDIQEKVRNGLSNLQEGRVRFVSAAARAI